MMIAEFDLGDGVEIRARELSASTGVSLRHTRRCLDLLEMSDLIEIDPVYWPTTTGVVMSRYRLVRKDEW